MRVPASFCGLHGIRPTHGRLDLAGMMPQAPSSDTTGWFARDADTFARVAQVLLGEPIPTSLPARLVVAVDAFGFADAETAAALQPMVRALSALVRDVREDLLAPPGLSVWARAQRTLQPYEAWLDLQGLDRSGEPAHGLQRRPQPGAGQRDSRERAAVGRADARRGAGPPHLAAPARDHPVPADDALPRAPEGPARSRRSSRCARASPVWPPTAA